MKNLKKIICLFVLICLGLVISPAPNKTNTKISKAASSTPLVSPTCIQVIDDDIFVYDSSSGILYKRNKNAPAQGEPSPDFLASVSVPGLISMQATTSGDLLALTETNGEKAFVIIQNNLTSVTPVTLSLPSYQLNMVIAFSYENQKVSALKTNGEIDTFALSGNHLTLVTTGTITKTNLNLINEEQNPLKHIKKKQDNLYLATDYTIYQVNTSSWQVQNVYHTPNNTNTILSVSVNSSLNVLLSGGIIAFVGGQTTHHAMGTELNFLHASPNGTLYASSKSTHQIFMVEGTSLTDLKFNETITPVLFNTAELKFASVKESCGLYLQPYSITPSATLNSGDQVVIIGTAPTGYNYYLCLYVLPNGTSQILYLKKDAGLNFYAGPSSQTVTLASIRKLSVYTYPSQSVNTLNQELTTIPAGTEITAASTTIFNGADGNLYYLVSYGGKTGYALSSCLQPLKGTVELTLNCNAKTKRETILYEDENGTTPIFSLPQNTRISLKEDISPNKTYTLVQYETETGITYTGYIFTDDINPDGLSTLQVLGITLVCVNLVVLSLILIVKIRSKKWKRTSAFSTEED